MRLATLIISLVLMLVVGFQSCASSVGGALGDESLGEGAALGVLVTLAYLVGGAFVIRYPKVSVVVFAIGGVVGLLGGASTPFRDLTVWGVVALGLALMSYFGVGERARKIGA